MSLFIAGELPPYFVARAAAASGRAVEELQEVEALEQAVAGDVNDDVTTADGLTRSASNGQNSSSTSSIKKKQSQSHDADSAAAMVTGRSPRKATSAPDMGKSGVGTSGGSAKHGRSLLERAKLGVFESIQKYGFTAILLAASIPNPVSYLSCYLLALLNVGRGMRLVCLSPADCYDYFPLCLQLFDLAGITCGHFGIPFATFFGATLLGEENGHLLPPAAMQS